MCIVSVHILRRAWWSALRVKIAQHLGESHVGVLTSLEDSDKVREAAENNYKCYSVAHITIRQMLHL